MTAKGESTVVVKRPQVEVELDDLRERLAEAWWNEEPLHEIQQIEDRIEECKRQLRAARQTAH